MAIQFNYLYKFKLINMILTRLLY